MNLKCDTARTVTKPIAWIVLLGHAKLIPGFSSYWCTGNTRDGWLILTFDATPTINLQVMSALLSSSTLPTCTTFRNNLHWHQESHHSCLQASKLAVHATSIGTRYTMHMCMQSWYHHWHRVHFQGAESTPLVWAEILHAGRDEKPDISFIVLRVHHSQKFSPFCPCSHGRFFSLSCKFSVPC